MKLRTLLPLYLSALLGTAAAGAALLLVPPERGFTARMVLVWPHNSPRPLPSASECRAVLRDPNFVRKIFSWGSVRASGLFDGCPDPLPADWLPRKADVRPDPDLPGRLLVFVAGPDPMTAKKQVRAVCQAVGEEFSISHPSHWNIPVVPSEDWSGPWSRAIPLGLSTWALSTALGLSLLARRRKGPSLPPESLVSAPALSPGPEGLQDFPPPPPTRCAQAPGELT